MFRQVTSELRGCPSPRPPERRREFRAPVTGPVVVTPCEQRDGTRGEPFVGRAADVSASGVAVLCGAPMEIGRSFVLYLPSREGEPRVARYTVRNCRAEDADFFRVGAELDDGVTAVS